MTAINIRVITWSLMRGGFATWKWQSRTDTANGTNGGVLIVLLMPAISVEPIFQLRVPAARMR